MADFSEPEEGWEETKKSLSFRQIGFVALAALILAGAAVWYELPRWRERGSIQITRQWLAVGKLDRAGEAVQTMLARAPKRVEAWQLAAVYARAVGQKQKAAAYLRQAAALDPHAVELTLDWAAAAFVADRLDEAENALAQIPAAVRSGSAQAERLAGEIARARGNVGLARTYFESAVRLGVGAAENEIPLGIVLASASSPEERARGRALLQRWRRDQSWGLEALRALLADAVVREESAAMTELALELARHERAENADVLNALLALSKSNAAHFAETLDALEQRWSEDLPKIAELVGWLSGIGQGKEAVRWLGTLPRSATDKPPVIVAWADALRVVADWPALREISREGDWAEVDFLRQAYLAMAEEGLGKSESAVLLWRGLRESARLNGGRALFLAGTVYAWGRQSEAVDLWWLASEQPGVAASALGALARHYQMQRDAEGLYRAFRQLYEIKSDDRRVANNYAYFAALTGHNLPVAERIARDNRAKAPGEMNYVSTHAFVLFSDGRRDDAVALLPEFLPGAKNSPGLAFTGGILLASVGRATEARELLAKVDRRNLTLREAELLDAAQTMAAR